MDAKNNIIRNLCINKNFSLKQYEKASALLKEFNIDLLTYVHIKSPFLNENEAIKEAVTTSKYAFKHGSSAVSLEPIFIMEYTLVDYLYKKGKFRPPWLWSVVEVAKSICKLGEVRINTNDLFETSYKYPRNYCRNDECTMKLRKRIFKYNQSLDINVLTDFYCDCKEAWKKEINKKCEVPLIKRIPQYIHQTS